MDIHDRFSWSGMAGSAKDMFNVTRNCLTIFQSGCNVLHYRQQYVSSSCSTTSSPLAVVRLFNFSPSNASVWVCHSGLKFPWWRKVLNISLAYGPFVDLLLLVFKLGCLSYCWVVGFLYIFWTPVLCLIRVCTVNIISQSVICQFKWILVIHRRYVLESWWRFHARDFAELLLASQVAGSSKSPAKVTRWHSFHQPASQPRHLFWKHPEFPVRTFSSMHFLKWYMMYEIIHKPYNSPI